MKVTILGGGAWGTALACVLADNGHQIMLWAYEHDVVDDINIHHSNRYLKDICLSPLITATNDIQEAINYADIIFVAIPVAFIRTSLIFISNEIACNKTWVMTSKGIERHTLLLSTQIVENMWNECNVVAVSGPTFAYDLARKQCTGIVVASYDNRLSEHVYSLLANDYLFPELSSDVIGLQLYGALKNVIALEIGILDGAGYTDNTKAYFLTRALHEMMQLGKSLGAQQETFYGLAGIGDTVLTAMGNRSKNLEVGRSIGKGEPLAEITQRMSFLPEGINTLQSVHELILQKHRALPLCQAVYEVVFKQKPVQTMLSQLTQ